MQDLLPAANAAPLDERLARDLLAWATALLALALLTAALGIGFCVLARALPDGAIVAMALLGSMGSALAACADRMTRRTIA